MLQRDTADFITADLWPPNSPDLNTVDYRICGVYFSKVFIRNMLKLNADELKQLLIEACAFVLASSKVSLIKRLTNGEFTLMHVSKPKESMLKTCCDVLFHNCQ